jgi:hypothetical protein
MVNYKCTRCFKIFTQKGHYVRHINRKNKCIEKSSIPNDDQNNNDEYPKNGICIPKVGYSDFRCEYCNRTYKHKFHLNRHTKLCKNKEDNLLKEELFHLLLENQKKQEENYEKILENQEKNYEKKIKMLQEQISKINTGTINYYTQNVQNIQVLAYNKTDVSHLKDKDYKKVLRRGNFCVPNLVDAIHFNPNKPENHNIYIPNMKTGYIMCWNGESWDIRNREDVIDDIYDEKSNLLIDKVDEWEDIGYKLDPIIMTKFKRFLSKMDDDVVKNKVKEEIRFLLYNKRNRIKNKS